MKKQNEGITLVALVITIIVLIILAGVSINAVMNGGLITNAKDAKNEYEEGKDEETNEIENLTSKTEAYMLRPELEKQGLKYNPTKKYITGIKMGIANTIETVAEFKERIPGYTVYKDGIEVSDADAATLTMATGMVVKKAAASGKIIEVGTIIVYGDIDYDGYVGSSDSVTVDDIIGNIGTTTMEDIQKIAADVNHDGNITDEDSQIITNYEVGSATINQDIEVGNNIPTI